MFEFKKLCEAYEKLSAAERYLLLAEKSSSILTGIARLSIPVIDPVSVLAGFIIASVTADGKIDEKEYAIMYPALVRTFGGELDLKSLKNSFYICKNVAKMISDYTEKMITILKYSDEELKWDIIMFCLCITSIDEKISRKEKRYIRRLCEA